MRSRAGVLLCLTATTVAWSAPTSTITVTTTTSATTLAENPQGRRAIRGAPIDSAQESEELRQLRQFDEQSFPRR